MDCLPGSYSEETLVNHTSIASFAMVINARALPSFHGRSFLSSLHRADVQVRGAAGPETCTPCAAGSASASYGAASQLSCEPCRPGFAAAAGSALCSAMAGRRKRIDLFLIWGLSFSCIYIYISFEVFGVKGLQITRMCQTTPIGRVARLNVRLFRAFTVQSQVSPQVFVKPVPTVLLTLASLALWVNTCSTLGRRNADNAILVLSMIRISCRP